MRRGKCIYDGERESRGWRAYLTRATGEGIEMPCICLINRQTDSSRSMRMYAFCVCEAGRERESVTQRERETEMQSVSYINGV